MPRQERPEPLDILALINGALEASGVDVSKEVFKPVGFEAVRLVSERIFRIGTDKEKEDLTHLKDTASILVRAQSDGAHFPQSEGVREKFDSVAALYKDYTAKYPEGNKTKQSNTAYQRVGIAYREFRSQALSHIFSVEPDALPEGIRDQVATMRAQYDAIAAVEKPPVERKSSEDILVMIDGVMPKDPFSLDEVRGFTAWMHHSGATFEGGSEDRDEITLLKDRALVLVVDPLVKSVDRQERKYFPGTEALRRELVSIMKEAHGESLNSQKYIEFRNKALSHALLANPDEFDEPVANALSSFRERYGAVEEKYRDRYMRRKKS